MKMTDTESAELAAQKQTVTTNVTASEIDIDPGSDASPPTGERHVPFGAVPEQSGTAFPDGMDNAASVANENVKVKNVSLSPEDQALKAKQESLILEGKKDIGKGTLTIGIALYTIHSKGLWKEFESFDDYAKHRLGLEKSQSYRLLKLGRFVNKLLNSPQADSVKDKLPITEIQFRALNELPESHWCAFWLSMTAYRDPAMMTRADIEEEMRVYMKRNKIKLEKTVSKPTTKVGRVLSKFKDLKDDLSKLKGLDRIDPRIQDLVALLEQGSQGVSNPDETSPEEFNSAVQQGTELLVAREQGGSPFDWEAFLPGVKRETSESEKTAEATV